MVGMKVVHLGDWKDRLSAEKKVAQKARLLAETWVAWLVDWSVSLSE